MVLCLSNRVLFIENEPVLITYDKYTKIRTDDNFSLTMPSNITVYYKNRTLKIRIELHKAQAWVKRLGQHFLRNRGILQK